MMRISYQFFLHAIALLFWALGCLRHDISQHAAVIPMVQDAHRAYPSSYELPTPTTKHSGYRNGHWKTSTHCITSTLHPTSTSSITSSFPHHRITLHCSTKVDRSHATPKHKRPIHGSDHKWPNKTKRRHSRTTSTMRTATHIATATPTLGLQQIASDQMLANEFLNDYFNTPASLAFDSIAYTKLSSPSPSSSFPPETTTITTSDATRVSTLTGFDTKDKLATQLADGNGSSYTSFGSGLGLGIGCMAIVFGLAGFLVYYRRRQRQSPSMIQGIAFFSSTDEDYQQKRTRRQPQSFTDAVTSDMSELPRTCHPGGMGYTGIAIGSGHGAVELARQPSGVLIQSPPPLDKIPPYQY